MLKWIKQWYNGQTTMVEFDNDPNSGVFVFPMWVTTYHWTAQIARRFVKFHSEYWQFMWGTVIGVASLVVGILSLK